MKQITPPLTENELLDRAIRLSGLTIQELANEYNLKLPKDSIHSKGWLGKVLENILGASAGNLPAEDFLELGIELKSIPLKKNMEPAETTFVTYVPLTNTTIESSFVNSTVFKKLKKILWIPFLGDKDIPFPQRIIFTPFLWSPNQQEFTILKNDWDEHMEKISLGKIEIITAKQGIALQIRPKCSSGSSLTDAIGEEGKIVKTRPRGFYLRTSFTKKIIFNAYQISS